MKKYWLLFLLPVLLILSGCLLESEVDIIKLSDDRTDFIVGKYIDTDHNIYDIYKLGSFGYQYKGSKFITLEANAPSDKVQEILSRIDSSIADAKKKGSDGSDNELKKLNTIKEKILSKEEIAFQDNVTFSTHSFGNGWFIAQIKNVFDIGFHLFWSGPKKFDLVIGNVQGNQLLLYETKSCIDQSHAKNYGVTLENSKITNINSYHEFISFIDSCVVRIKQEKKEPSVTLVKLSQ